MKKILITSNIFLLSIIIFFACNPSQPTQDCNAIVSDYSGQPWEGRIRANFARSISQKYLEDDGKKLVSIDNSPTQIEDALSINFKLSILKRFIWEMESRACKAHCTDTLGIRFYYAKYPQPQDPIWSEAGMAPFSEYANMHTLFAVPTYQDGNGKYINYDPAIGCRKPFVFGPAAKPGLVFFAPGGEGADSDAQNHGGLMPPPAGGGTF